MASFSIRTPSARPSAGVRFILSKLRNIDTPIYCNECTFGRIPPKTGTKLREICAELKGSKAGRQPLLQVESKWERLCVRFPVRTDQLAQRDQKCRRVGAAVTRRRRPAAL